MQKPSEDETDQSGDLAAMRCENAALRAEIAELHERHRREIRAAEEARERFELVMRGTREAMWDWDIATDRVFFSGRFNELLGLPSDDGMHEINFWSDRLHPDDRQRVADAVIEHRATDNPYDVEYRLLDAMGEYRWFRARAVTVRDAQGRPSRMSGSIGDIHDRRRLQKLKRESARAARIGGWQLELLRPALYWTSQTHAIHETDPDEFVPSLETAIDFYSEESRPIISHLVKDCAEHGRSFDVELQILTRSGRRVPVHVRGFAEWESGQIVRLFGSIQDVSTFKELERQLFQAQKMESIGRLAGGIAHDFNNIMTAIRGYSDLLACGLPPDDPRLEDFQEIAKASDRAAALTEQLLAFARKQVVVPVEVRVRDLVHEIRLLLTRAVGADRSLEIEVLEDHCPVLIDPIQLEQVLMNLIINARDATPPGGRIIVSTREVQAATDSGRVLEHVEISVRDSGCGMTQETMQSIFEPFYTTKERGKGSGLGLATCYGIVKQAEGRIEVTSQPEVGSVFRVLLPCAHQAKGV